MEVETPDDDTGATILVFFICAGLLALLIWYLFYRDATPEDESLTTDDSYQAYNDMSPEELARTIADATADYYAWNDSQFFPLAGGTIGGATSNLPMNVPRLMTVMTGAVLLDPGTLRIALNILKRRILSMPGAMSEARLAYRMAKATVAGGEKLLTRLGVRAAARAATAGAARLAVASTQIASMGAAAAAAGPAAPIVAIAEFVFAATLGMLDQFGVGGYTELVPAEMYEGMRDEWDRFAKEDFAANGAEWPCIAGPLDAISQSDYEAKLIAAMDTIMDDVTHPVSVLIQALYAERLNTLGRDLTDEEYDAMLLTDDVGKKCNEATLALVIEQVGGKLIRLPSGNVACSYTTREAAEASFVWPLSDERDKDIYCEWNEEGGYAQVGQSSMRTLAESLGNGCTYNFETRLPNLTEAYCRGNGLDYSGGQCRYADGQEIAEAIFGRTFIRGLTQVFDPKQYKDCADTDWCYGGLDEQGVRRNPTSDCLGDFEGLTGIVLGQVGSTYFCRKERTAFSRAPHDMKCQTGYYETTPGFCKKNCDNAAEDGRLYKPKDGLCYHPDVDFSSWPSGLVKTGSLEGCPDGSDDVAGTCWSRGPCRTYDDPCANRAPNWLGGGCLWGVKTTGCPAVTKNLYERRTLCPTGYRQVGATCEAVSARFDETVYSIADKGECTDGREREGLLCYDKCPDAYEKVPGGLMCQPRQGPKIEMKAKERAAAYSTPDFENSPVGKRANSLGTAIRTGDARGIAQGLACLSLATNPVVTGLGMQDFVNMIPDSETGVGVEQT
jgi:hypothetical protein